MDYVFGFKKADYPDNALAANPENGDYVRDKVTRVEGIMVCRAEWLNRCVRITIQPQEVREGKPVDSYCCDIEQVEVLEKAYYTMAKRPTGGPMPDPKRQADPKR